MAEIFQPSEQQPGRAPVYRLDPRLLRRIWADKHRLAQDKERARFTLERLRYRRYVKDGSLSHFMQRLGDFGRTWAGALAAFKAWR